MQCMLAGKCEDVMKLKFPVMVSHKLDGIRALVISGQVVSRQLKPIPNAWVQKQFGGLPEGTDGELILGDPTDPEAYRKTVSAVMSEDGEPTFVSYHVFDNFKYEGGFKRRFSWISTGPAYDDFVNVIVVGHRIVDTADELNKFEEEAVNAGHEGVMIRSLDGPYKNGRSTSKEGYLLKLKRFEDGEAVVLSTDERMHNGNVATEDALGHTQRSSHQENLTGLGDLGALNVRGVGGKYDGVEFSIGTGFNAEERREFWKIRLKLIGKTVKFKFFPLGSKERPRFPVYLGWRSRLDL